MFLYSDLMDAEMPDDGRFVRFVLLMLFWLRASFIFVWIRIMLFKCSVSVTSSFLLRRMGKGR